MKNKFNKRWKAKLYIVWLKVKNRFIHKNITFESYGINHTIPENTYSVIELLLTEKIEKEMAIAMQEEIQKYKN